MFRIRTRSELGTPTLVIVFHQIDRFVIAVYFSGGGGVRVGEVKGPKYFRWTLPCLYDATEFPEYISQFPRKSFVWWDLFILRKSSPLFDDYLQDDVTNLFLLSLGETALSSPLFDSLWTMSPTHALNWSSEFLLHSSWLYALSLLSYIVMVIPFAGFKAYDSKLWPAISPH